MCSITAFYLIILGSYIMFTLLSCNVISYLLKLKKKFVYLLIVT